ncbi:hypothetical protein B0I37DRAFT_358331 [Chaetomium sp. MPI-CAGE-AT-0009]|nr:hypothetical protein B0I37DRAFT_358331 [Chaetomium sp. MPI-CAGE-AT-0009]
MPSSMVVVIQLTKSRQRETQRRLHEYGVKAAIFRAAEEEEQDEDSVSSVILVTPEAAAQKAWKTFVSHQHLRSRIDRVILDEAHEVLINSGFRRQMERCREAMDRISPRQIYAT